MIKKAGIVIFFLLVTISFGSEKLIFSKIENTLGDISAAVLKEAYARIGYTVEFINMPPKRALLESNEGRVDGEVHRIKGISEKFSNLIMVNIPVNYYELRLFSKKYDFYIENKEMLKNYVIGATRGILLFERYLADLNASYERDSSININKLKADRIDFLMMNDISGREVVKENSSSGIKMMEPALQTVYLYHYLNEKNKHLVPEITMVLNKMKESGELERIRDRFLEEI